MRQRVLKQLTGALRSGEYKQGYNCLHSLDSDGNERYCPLGVLTDLAIKSGECGDLGWSKRFSFDGMNILSAEDAVNSSRLLPPESVQRWAGMEESNPFALGEKVSHWNDAYRYSFSEIADILEEEFERGRNLPRWLKRPFIM